MLVSARFAFPLSHNVREAGVDVATGVVFTVKEEALVEVPLGDVTDITPEVVAAATTAVMVVEFTTVKLLAAVPLIDTAVVPVKEVPVIVTVAPVQIGLGLKLKIAGALYTQTEPFKVDVVPEVCTIRTL